MIWKVIVTLDYIGLYDTVYSFTVVKLGTFDYVVFSIIYVISLVLLPHVVDFIFASYE